MFVLLFLHLATVFTGISLIFGSFAIALLAERVGRPSAIAAMYGVGFDRLIGPIMGVGGLFGLATGFTFGYNLLAPWLIIAYVLFAAATIWGLRVSGPTYKQISALVEDGSSDGGNLSVEARQLFGRLHLDAGVTAVIVFAIIADMVFKPFLV